MTELDIAQPPTTNDQPTDGSRIVGPALTLLAVALAIWMVVWILEARTDFRSAAIGVDDWLLVVAVGIGGLGIMGLAAAVGERFRLAGWLKTASVEAEAMTPFVDGVIRQRRLVQEDVEACRAAVHAARRALLAAHPARRSLAQAGVVAAEEELGAAHKRHGKLSDSLEELLPRWVDKVDEVLNALAHCRAVAAQRLAVPGAARADDAWARLTAARNALVVTAKLQDEPWGEPRLPHD